MKAYTFLFFGLIVACGCSRPFVNSKTLNMKPTMAQVHVLRIDGDDKTFETTDAMVITKLQEWLKEIEPTQLPPTQLGNVVPWCTIIFFDDPGISNAVATNSVYAIRDGTTQYRLLTTQQRQKLLDIFGLQDDFKDAPP